jgi:hypothetical protein
MRAVIIFLGVVALALVIASVLVSIPADALTMGLGVGCGIVASIPVSLGLLIALTRPHNYDDSSTAGSPRQPAPEPVQTIIVTRAVRPQLSAPDQALQQNEF